jgi:hypothetical protein
LSLALADMTTTPLPCLAKGTKVGAEPRPLFHTDPRENPMTQPTNSQPPVELTDTEEQIILGVLITAFEREMAPDESEAIGKLIDLFEDRIAERHPA